MWVTLVNRKFGITTIFSEEVVYSVPVYWPPTLRFEHEVVGIGNAGLPGILSAILAEVLVQKLYSGRIQSDGIRDASLQASNENLSPVGIVLFHSNESDLARPESTRVHHVEYCQVCKHFWIRLLTSFDGLKESFEFVLGQKFYGRDGFGSAHRIYGLLIFV